jgi:hypothetical protein
MGRNATNNAEVRVRVSIRSMMCDCGDLVFAAFYDTKISGMTGHS